MRKIYFISALITTILVSFDSFGAMIIGAALPMSYDSTKLVQNEDGSYTYNYNDAVSYKGTMINGDFYVQYEHTLPYVYNGDTYEYERTYYYDDNGAATDFVSLEYKNGELYDRNYASWNGGGETSTNSDGSINYIVNCISCGGYTNALYFDYNDNGDIIVDDGNGINYKFDKNGTFISIDSIYKDDAVPSNLDEWLGWHGGGSIEEASERGELWDNGDGTYSAYLENDLVLAFDQNGDANVRYMNLNEWLGGASIEEALEWGDFFDNGDGTYSVDRGGTIITFDENGDAIMSPKYDSFSELLEDLGMYDMYNRVYTYWNGTSPIELAENSHTEETPEYKYTETTTLDENGSVMVMKYNDDGEGIITMEIYDENGKLVKTVEANGNIGTYTVTNATVSNITNTENGKQVETCAASFNIFAGSYADMFQSTGDCETKEYDSNGLLVENSNIPEEVNVVSDNTQNKSEVKRIYTVQEATALVKNNKNTFTLKYR